MNLKIPKGWNEIIVNDAFKLGRGRVISKNEIRDNLGKYPVFSSQSKDSGKMGSIASYDFDGEYITWTTDGAYAGTVFYRKGKFNCTNVCGTLQDNKNYKIHLPFVASYLYTVAKKHVSYVGNPKLMNNTFSEISFLSPPLPEQIKIAKILTSVDEVIETTETQINKLKDLKKGLMNELLTKGIGHTEFKDSPVGRIPVGWEVTTLKKGINLISGQHIEAKYCSNFSNGMPYLTGPADFPNTKIIITKYTNSPKVVCKHQDILLTVKGSGCGRIIISDNEYCISRQLMAIRVLDWNFKFIYYSLISNASKFEADASGLIPGISRSDVMETQILVPPLPEQQKIASILTSIDTNIEKKQNKLTQSKNLKKSLMADLLTGRVRVKVN